MDQCEFLDVCFFVKNSEGSELKAAYCDSAPLRCARFMTYQALGEGVTPDDLMPDEKMKAYELLAEN